MKIGVNDEWKEAHFDISMYVAMMMKILQTLQYLTQYSGYNCFPKTVWVCSLQYVKARPPSHEWHDNPQSVTTDKGAVRFQYIRMVNQDHSLCFTVNIILWQTQKNI